MPSFKTLEWTDDGLLLLDQLQLPAKVEYRLCRNYREVASAIRDMVIRGAPAIGVAAALGIALGVKRSRARSLDELRGEFPEICDTLRQTRPTAVNLFWAIERMQRRFEASAAVAVHKAAADALAQVRNDLEDEGLRIYAEDIAINQAIGRQGAVLMPAAGRVLTHCNAGALATAGYGTALGVIRAALESGKTLEVFADETRPYLQGARLTAWELQQDGIRTTVITDNMAGHFLRKGGIQAVVVGADRIAANGDVANKIGTYSIAVLAHENGVPFYVAAPLSTLDLSLATGDEIPIEQRSPREVTHIQNILITPADVAIANPAFDITPNRYVSAIITEAGVARAPYEEALRRLASSPQSHALTVA